MRLKHIKLSGFKSFVDPTEVSFPGQVSGVVGPNGCGKSNIIDAVRWVMGESSAKHLRGESLADVIFNGAAGRNPVGQASVELVFDNSEGRLGGEYAKYAEVAIRRLVNREGQSIYFLNNTKCRRKDIMDIFRGTGLGPRSYAIIEQGMISRLIEAKPEELRVYLEEAAGITKYKDRRRETELRIEHTKANLSRLFDLREELGSQLERLQRQAKAAEKYKALKIEEHQYNTQWHALRWQGLNAQMTAQKQQVNDLAVVYERHAAEHTHTATQIERVRQDYADCNEAVQTRQAAYYKASAEVTRIEQDIHHLKQRKQTLQNDLAEVQQQYEHAKNLMQTDTNHIAQHEKLLSEIEPQLAEQEQKLLTAQSELEAAEKQLAASQQQWDIFHQQRAEQQKNTELLRVQIQHAEEKNRTYQERIRKLQEEQQQLTTELLLQEKEHLSVALKEEERSQGQLAAQIVEKTQALNDQQNKNQDYRQQVHQLRVDLQKLQGQQASLVQLQKAALGQDNQSLTDWLTQHQLLQYPRLAEGLRVTSGWELAVEFALKAFLPAVVLQQLDTFSRLPATHLPGELSIYLPAIAEHQASTRTQWTALRTQVQTEWPLTGLLAGIYCAPDLPTALALRDELNAHESFITPEGTWLGKDWLRTYQADAAEAGVIVRQQSLATLDKQITEQTQLVERLSQEWAEGEQRVAALDKERETLRLQDQQYQRENAGQQAKSGK